MTDSTQRVLDRVDPESLVELTAQLVRIPSENPPGKEAEIALFLDAHLRSLGLEVRTQEAFPGRHSVIATLRGEADRPKLILNGHIDVVPAGDGWTHSPFGAEVRDGRMYGRGTSDMKAGVAAMVGAVNAIKQAGVHLRGTVEIHAVVDEEESQGGTKAIVLEGLQADYGIVCEPTRLRPFIAHKGDFYFEIVTRGRAAHGSVPEKGNNAVYQMCRVIERIQCLHEELKALQHPILGSPTIMVGTIQGGTVTCAVPAECRIAIDRRVIPGEDEQSPERQLQHILDECRREDPEFEGEVRSILKAPAMEIAADEPIVRAVQRATEQVLGQQYEPGGLSGTCDANWMVNVARIPTLILGPGDLGVAHTADEYVELDDIANAARIYALTILDLIADRR